MKLLVINLLNLINDGCICTYSNMVFKIDYFYRNCYKKKQSVNLEK